MQDVTLQVSAALDLINQTLEAAYPFIIIEGEIASFTVSKQKFVFFDIKDQTASLGCFMMVFNLKFPLEDGMKVKLVAQPKLTNWGKFSLTVHEIIPVGEGSIKKSFELLKTKLTSEGLFEIARKRTLPTYPQRVGIVSSSGAAGWADFTKVLQQRWGGLDLLLADIQVQGLQAPGQIIRAIEYFNALSQPLDVLVLVRGGGSADDLAAFNHEEVVRAIATSRTPTLIGVGHETDTTLADLAADIRAATPSNAAQLLVPDKNQLLQQLHFMQQQMSQALTDKLTTSHEQMDDHIQNITLCLNTLVDQTDTSLHGLQRTVQQLNPQLILQRGYSVSRVDQRLIRSYRDVTIGETIAIELAEGNISAEVTDAHN